MSETEETLVIIKPDGIKYIEEIIAIFYNNSLKIQNYQLTQLNTEILKEHYAHLINESYYKDLESYMTSGLVAIMILEGENAVEKLRTLMGNTDSKKANKDTIRGKYGTDVLQNVIHGSDSRENATIEISRFFKKGPVKKLSDKYLL